MSGNAAVFGMENPEPPTNWYRPSLPFGVGATVHFALSPTISSMTNASSLRLDISPSMPLAKAVCWSRPRPCIADGFGMILVVLMASKRNW